RLEAQLAQLTREVQALRRRIPLQAARPPGIGPEQVEAVAAAVAEALRPSQAEAVANAVSQALESDQLDAIAVAVAEAVRPSRPPAPAASPEAGRTPRPVAPRRVPQYGRALDPRQPASRGELPARAIPRPRPPVEEDDFERDPAPRTQEVRRAGPPPGRAPAPPQQPPVEDEYGDDPSDEGPIDDRRRPNRPLRANRSRPFRG